MDEQTPRNDANFEQISEDDFEILAIRYLDGLLDETETELLSRNLAASADLRDSFAELSTEMGMLSEMHLASGLCGSANHSPPDHVRSSPGLTLSLEDLESSPLNFGGLLNPRASLYWLLFAVLAVGGLAGWAIRSSISEPARNLAQVEPVSTAVAHLSLANGCDWGGGSPRAWTVGGGVQSGDEITLYEGIAEFRLASGVSLSIEGPTTLVMTSANSLLLQHGKLTAYVPWAVSDFTLITAACRLTASDAEFGVYAAGGDVDIHTFSGEVLATSEFQDSLVGEIASGGPQKTAEGSEFLASKIAAGRGLTLANKGGVTKVSRWHRADKDNFATKLTMAGSLPINREYVESVMQSKPISYWRFEAIQDGFIRNEIEGQSPLKIFGDLRLIGDSTNRVAELGHPGADGYLLSDTGLILPSSADYSVEMWVKPSHLQSGTLAVFLADFAQDHKERAAFLLAILGAKHEPGISQRYPGKMRFLHRNPPGPSATTGTSCFSSSNYALRRWQHVVATKQNGQMRLFIDGTLAATAEDTSPQASHFNVLVGRLSTSRQVAPLIGQLDELIIYDRALEEGEISKRLKLLKWKSEGNSPSRNKDA